jgi:hypothetical protein
MPDADKWNAGATELPAALTAGEEECSRKLLTATSAK